MASMLRSWRYWALVLATLPVVAAAAERERSPVPGLYQTTIEGVSGYVSADGRYFVVGDMLDLKLRTNITEDGRKARRRALLQQIVPGEAIVFGPANPAYTIMVFTDADCPYCRKLHGELEQLQSKGIAVRYLAFPRSGPNSKSWRTMSAVWCASNRRDALTRATRGDEVSARAGTACGDAVIAKHYALGQQLGIPGTPMIVLSDGTSLGGYMSPDQLLAALKEHASEQ
jgi:thiol:disulfide interchange protein DsbC